MRAHTEVWRGIGYDAPRELIESPEMPGFLAEADAFAALVREGWSAWPGTTPQESIDIAAMLEALAQSAKSGQAVKIG
jgi:predicted dehydrogenase